MLGLMFTKSLGLDELEPKQQLLLAVGVFLRQLKSDKPQELGFFLRILLEDTDSLKFEVNTPELPENRIVYSNGVVLKCVGIPDELRFVWLSKYRHHRLAQNSLIQQCCVKSRSTVSLRWLEWALAYWYIEFDAVGLDWQPEDIVVKTGSNTIGGIELAEFLT